MADHVLTLKHFFEEVRAGRLTGIRCGKCGELAIPPKELCPACGERAWQLPLWEEYYEQIKSDVADVKNTGGRPGGTITAAAFLSKFVGGAVWAHLDIASTDWSDRERAYIPKGATGVGTRLLIQFLSNRANGRRAHGNRR